MILNEIHFPENIFKFYPNLWWFRDDWTLISPSKAHVKIDSKFHSHFSHSICFICETSFVRHVNKECVNRQRKKESLGSGNSLFFTSREDGTFWLGRHGPCEWRWEGVLLKYIRLTHSTLNSPVSPVPPVPPCGLGQLLSNVQSTPLSPTYFTFYSEKKTGKLWPLYFKSNSHSYNFTITRAILIIPRG